MRFLLRAGLVLLVTVAYGALFVLYYDVPPGSYEGSSGGAMVVVIAWFLCSIVSGWLLGRFAGAGYGLGIALLMGPLYALRGEDPNAYYFSAIFPTTIAFTTLFSYLPGTISDLYADARARNAALERTSAALGRSEAMFRHFAERIETGVWIMEPDARRVTYLNPAARRMFQVPEGETVGKDLTHPDDRELALSSYAALRRGESTDVEYRIHRDGEVRWLRAQSFPVVDARGEVNLLVGLIEDVTERKERELRREILERRERLSALGTLVAGVAHEVNNPLTYIMGNLELAQRDLGALRVEPGAEASLARVGRLLATSRGGGERIAKLVKALRAVTRPAGEGSREQVHLNALAANVHELIRPSTPPGIALELRLDERDPIVEGSGSELHQVILNLATNAIQALGGQRGRVVLQTRQEGGKASVSVRDDGPGIAPEAMSRLFTPFYTTKPEGTGLGLSLAHAIVRDHGGDIEVASEPKMGAEFRVRLPLMAPQAVTA